MSQSLIKKAFCFAQYSCIGRLVARSVLNGKVNPNHDVYRNTDPIHLDVFRQLSIHEKSVEKLYEIFEGVSSGWMFPYTLSHAMTVPTLRNGQ